jgi:hypothetical protein
MVRKSNNRKRAAENFKKFSRLLPLLINVNRNTALQRTGMEIATFLSVAAEKFSLLSYWLVPAAFLYRLEISQRLPNSLCAFPSGFPILFRNFPEAAQ